MNRDAVITREFPPVLERYTAKETILYALGIGVGVKDSLDRDELPFLNSKALRIVPSQAAVLCFPGPWLSFPELGIDYSMVLHGGQGMAIGPGLVQVLSLIDVIRHVEPQGWAKRERVKNLFCLLACSLAFT